MDAKNIDIQTLQADIQRLEDENATLHSELEGYVGDDGTLSTIDNLLDAAQNFITNGDVTATGEKLEAVSEAVDIETSSEAFKNLYNTLYELIGTPLAERYYNDGLTAYRNGEYNTAIELLTKAVYYDETNVDALYNLANAYRLNGNPDDALDMYNRLIELFPDGDRASRSKRYIEEISAGGGTT